MNSIDQCFTAVSKILNNLPDSWLNLTTHRLDIYNEEQAKSQFLEHLKNLVLNHNFSTEELEQLPTAYDYIRLGHQLSSVLEWLLAEINQIPPEQVITFSSKTMPILAILRTNALANTATEIYYNTDIPPLIDLPRLEKIYGYHVNQHKINKASEIPHNDDASVVFVTQSPNKNVINSSPNVGVSINIHAEYGSSLIIHNTKKNDLSNQLIKAIQHVRRRETIAMSPVNCLNLLHEIINDKQNKSETASTDKINTVHDCIKLNTGSSLTPLIGSSGLSIQYAILMGLIEAAMNLHPEKPIKILLPPNCYGGTNDQARRIAELVPKVGIVDLLVDGGQDMVASLEIALNEVAAVDGVPIVLAEIPTNPRVEVPDMNQLAEVLNANRVTSTSTIAIEPTFMVDQTFCPHVKLLHNSSPLAQVKVVSFSSGSKFPSGGRCIAGYCAVNNAAKDSLNLISRHLILSDNSATPNQLNTLAENMPSMPERIQNAYLNTRVLVEHIRKTLPEAKINFVSNELAEQGFTPSVFSLDLPATGKTEKEREENKKQLNKKLIDFMISKHPQDCKYCVSYGQLKGSYWTIPATSTQGTTKENDKDYIVRVAVSPDVDISKLSQSFTQFCSVQKLI